MPTGLIYAASALNIYPSNRIILGFGLPFIKIWIVSQFEQVFISPCVTLTAGLGARKVASAGHGLEKIGLCKRGNLICNGDIEKTDYFPLDNTRIIVLL